MPEKASGSAPSWSLRSVSILNCILSIFAMTNSILITFKIIQMRLTTTRGAEKSTCQFEISKTVIVISDVYRKFDLENVHLVVKEIVLMSEVLKFDHKLPLKA